MACRSAEELLNITICIGTYGASEWETMAEERALPSAVATGAEVLIGHQTDGTIASTRNGLADRATSDWLCFLDADDELAPGYLDAMRRALEQERGGHPETTALLLTPAVSYVRNGRRAPPLFLDRGVPLTDDNWLVVGTLVERDLFMQVGGFSDYEHGFEDFSLWSKCWRIGARIVKVPDAVYIAHVNPRSKHRQAWRNRRWQRQMHETVRRELDEWERNFRAAGVS